MPEPTDHRAQAEHWVREFLDSIGPAAPNRQDMLRLAHIHALLAALPKPEPEPLQPGRVYRSGESFTVKGPPQVIQPMEP